MPERQSGREFLTELVQNSTNEQEKEPTLSQSMAEKAKDELGIKFGPNAEVRGGFWNHVITPKLMGILQDGEYDILCGELNIGGVMKSTYELFYDREEGSSFFNRVQNLGVGVSQSQLNYNNDAIETLFSSGVSLVTTDVEFRRW